MDGLKGHIYDWLIESDEEKAANFLENCEIDQMYIDTLFSMDSDVETYMYEVTVNVPLKIHRRINDYSQEVAVIESAITEAGLSDGIYVREICWRAYLKNEHQKQSEKKAVEITQLLTQEYVDRQIRLMNNSIENNPHLSLGISKELIETCCKHILNKAKIEINKDWDIGKLVKETNKQIDLMPFQVENTELAKLSIAKILSGFSNIVHGISELRNSYGTGHGHLPEFKNLDVIYIKLAVSASSELAIFYLSLEKIRNK
ncbi:abortive infection family protein [Chryseobacterium arthrosphaerae]|uniref:abortive infection family protein n=1 Tax=Chryseobacterium arthrosphaerae TaxID=651561 RepID=UPI0023E2CBE0|nr:abortive infection family protein [Chryseobacterium arthrosphaerae]WES99323.1 abortive infection family protein [Chryseobacterium arthrosphaerae]